jgi:hypothetical protein
MTPEGRVKAKVKRALATLRYHYHFMPVQNGMGAPALDYFCCIGGLFIAIETKVPGKELTNRQRVTANAIVAAHGIVYVIHDDHEIEQMMRALHGGVFVSAIHNDS